MRPDEELLLSVEHKPVSGYQGSTIQNLSPSWLQHSLRYCKAAYLVTIRDHVGKEGQLGVTCSSIIRSIIRGAGNRAAAVLRSIYCLFTSTFAL